MQKVQTMQRVLQEEPLYTVKPRGGHKVRESASTILRDPNLEATSLILQELENEHEFLCVPPLPTRSQTLSFTCSLQRCIVPSYSAVGTVPCYCAPFKDWMPCNVCPVHSSLAHILRTKCSVGCQSSRLQAWPPYLPMAIHLLVSKYSIRRPPGRISQILGDGGDTWVHAGTTR